MLALTAVAVLSSFGVPADSTSPAMVIPRSRSMPVPVFEIAMDGAVRLQRDRLDARYCPGTAATYVPGGSGFRFDGRRSAILLGDPKSLRLTKSLTIATWVRLEDHVAQGPGAQIFFRGDDRDGIDPYHLSVLPDRRVYFVVENRTGGIEWVAAPIPLGRWTHILASLDDKTGEMLLWLNGKKVDSRNTTVRPYKDLDKASSPGVGIGNVQNDRGPHNQPLRGDIARLEVYDRAVTPTELRLNFSPWISEG